MGYNAKEREEYNQHRDSVCDDLGITKNQYNAFRRLSDQLHRLDEWSCNGTKQDMAPGYHWEAIKEYTDDEYKADCAALYEKIIGMFTKMYKGKMRYFYHQTDPRGCSLYLSNEPVTDENRSSVGIAIY